MEVFNNKIKGESNIMNYPIPKLSIFTRILEPINNPLYAGHNQNIRRIRR